MSVIDARLKELGITLSTPPAPVAAYIPFTRSGNLVFISGQVPLSDGALKYVGKIGVDFSIEMGQAAAQLCAINILSVLKVACEGDPHEIRAPKSTSTCIARDKTSRRKVTVTVTDEAGTLAFEVGPKAG